MALAATTIFEIQTGGSDTANGGAFDPGQTAGMFTDGAATVATSASPVFTSASYNFVSGDIGAWVYVASGTNWTAGWYKIASVAANAATLSAAIGAAVLKTLTPTIATGCATTASPTGATWTIDYSQQATAQFTYTDLASVGAGLLVSSAAKPFAKQQVGNSLVITGGTNFTTGRYVIASVAAGVATCVGPTNITTGAGVNGTGGQGGALASPAVAASVRVAGNPAAIKSGTYSITTASTNVAGGCVSDAVGGSGLMWFGYGTVRGDFGTAPLLQASGAITTFVLFSSNGGTSGALIANISLDGASKSSSKGFDISKPQVLYKCSVANCTNVAYSAPVQSSLCAFCTATNTTGGAAAFNGPDCYYCEASGGSVPGFVLNTFQGESVSFCIAYSNTGGTTDGFQIASECSAINCTSYANGRDGFRILSGSQANLLANCLAEANTGFGFRGASTVTGTLLLNCGTYNNTAGSVDTASLQGPSRSFVANGTGSFFVNAAGGNFALNSTANQGALARAAGIPGAFPTAATTGFQDIGAVQHADPTDASVAPVIGGYF